MRLYFRDDYWQDTHRSLYIQIGVTKTGWLVNRHQITAGEAIFECLEENRLPDELQKFSPAIKETNGVHGAIIDIVIVPTAEARLDELAHLVCDSLAAR